MQAIDHVSRTVYASVDLQCDDSKMHWVPLRHPRGTPRNMLFTRGVARLRHTHAPFISPGAGGNEDSFVFILHFMCSQFDQCHHPHGIFSHFDFDLFEPFCDGVGVTLYFGHRYLASICAVDQVLSTCTFPPPSPLSSPLTVGGYGRLSLPPLPPLSNTMTTYGRVDLSTDKVH